MVVCQIGNILRGTCALVRILLTLRIKLFAYLFLSLSIVFPVKRKEKKLLFNTHVHFYNSVKMCRSLTFEAKETFRKNIAREMRKHYILPRDTRIGVCLCRWIILLPYVGNHADQLIKE